MAARAVPGRPQHACGAPPAALPSRRRRATHLQGLDSPRSSNKSIGRCPEQILRGAVILPYPARYETPQDRTANNLPAYALECTVVKASPQGPPTSQWPLKSLRPQTLRGKRRARLGRRMQRFLGLAPLHTVPSEHKSAAPTSIVRVRYIGMIARPQ